MSDITTYKAPKLMSYQQDVCNMLLEPNSYKTVVCKAKRQVGKSTMLAVLLLYYAINFKKTKSYCVSPTLAQAKNIFTQITDMTATANGLIVKKNSQDLELTLCNGSVIGFKSAMQGDRLRSFSVSGIMVIDEAAFISDDILPLILPWRDVNRAPLLIVSTPFVSSGFFYTWYMQGLDGLNGITSVDWMDSKYQPELDRMLPPERLEMYRRQLPEKQFTAEFLGQFIDSDGLVFSGYKELIENNRITPSDRLYIGIDWAIGETVGADTDETVVSIFNQNGRQVYIEYIGSLSPTEQADRITALLMTYKEQIRIIRPESNSIGSVYVDMLKKRLPSYVASRISEFTTTNDSKNAAVQNLQEAFERKSIRILPDDKQLRQLGAYAANFNQKTRTITYGNLPGLHDDAVCATMFAYDALLNSSTTGIYSISVV